MYNNVKYVRESKLKRNQINVKTNHQTLSNKENGLKLKKEKKNSKPDYFTRQTTVRSFKEIKLNSNQL